MNSGKSELNGRFISHLAGKNAQNYLHAFLKVNTGIVEFFLFIAVFLVEAYFSVSPVLPNAIPIHHDDYSNYAAGAGHVAVGWIRPLSSLAIHFLAALSPDCLIWAVRLLTVLYVVLQWRLFIEFCGEVKFRVLSSVFYASTVLATPIVAEYGRYTGMITHLISGCLGVAAALLVVGQARSPNSVKLYASLGLFLLSTLAKEDFILLYGVSLFYVLWFQTFNRTRIALVGMGALVLGGLFVIGAKVLAKSEFLGIPDLKSTYYVDTSLISITSTIIKYLKGAGHPAMIEHGKLYFSLVVFSVILFSAIGFAKRQIPKGVFLLVGGIAVVVPYSVLPNHVNAYYELLWLPLFLSAAVFAAINFFELIFKRDISAHVIVCPLLLVLAVVANVVDYSGRKSIAAWYDSVGHSNSLTLAALEEREKQINQAGEACISGADMFSPWYMHDGSYLANVLGLKAHWIVLTGKNRLLEQGILLGKDRSAVRVSVEASPNDFPNGCLRVDLAKHNKMLKSTGS